MPDFSPGRPLKIAVDLTQLRAGGENGGVKPFIFEYVGWLGEQRSVPVKLLFLTRRASHADVRPLARFSDELICVGDDGEGEVPHSRAQSPAEAAWYDAPQDLIARLGADLLYCPFGICSWSHPGIPTMATVVDVLHRDYPFTLQPGDIAYRESVFQEMVLRADCIQGISEHTLSRVAHHYGFPADRMFCSPIAIHGRLRAGTAAPLRREAGPPYFFYPANAWRHKNHETLFLAYGIYRSRAGADAWDLVLTGHADEAMRRLGELATTLGLDPHVRFLGYLPEDRLRGVWEGAGALVFPSLHEGFGIPLLEAMEFSLPIVCSRAGALPEVGGDACLYVDALKPLDMADALLAVTGNPGLRAEFQARGRRRLASFSFEKDARRFLDELVACAARPARLSRKGLDLDGWTGPQAFVGLPDWGRPAQVELGLDAMPAARELRIFHARNLVCHSRIPPGSAQSVRFPIWPDGKPISLVVPDASPLSEKDHRTHGVLVKDLRMRDSTGAELDLLAP